MGVTHNSCLVAAAIDVTDLRCRDNVDMWIKFWRFKCSWVTCLERNQTTIGILFVCTIVVLLISIDRVGGKITTGIQFLYLDRSTSTLFNNHCDGAIDSTVRVITTKYLIVCTIGYLQYDVVVHICICGTTEDSIHIGYTVHIQNRLSVDFRILSRSVGLVYIHVTRSRFLVH